MQSNIWMILITLESFAAIITITLGDRQWKDCTVCLGQWQQVLHDASCRLSATSDIQSTEQNITIKHNHWRSQPTFNSDFLWLFHDQELRKSITYQFNTESATVADCQRQSAATSNDFQQAVNRLPRLTTANRTPKLTTANRLPRLTTANRLPRLTTANRLLVESYC